MATFGPVAIKPPELGDLTSKGQDPAGCLLAVSLGVVAGGAAGIVAADNLKAPTRRSRAFVGLTAAFLLVLMCARIAVRLSCHAFACHALHSVLFSRSWPIWLHHVRDAQQTIAACKRTLAVRVRESTRVDCSAPHIVKDFSRARLRRAR